MIYSVLMIFLGAMILLNSSWILLLVLPREKTTDRENIYPSLSIVIPAYNEEKSIKSTLESALEAGYPGDKEILVVDDGSTDHTSSIVRSMARKHENIRLLRGSHSGKSSAMNRGSREAGNDIILMLDADSRLDPGALKVIVKPFYDEEVGAVSGIIRAADNNNPLTWFQDFEYVLSSCWRYICNKLDGTYILPGFSAYRKTALEDIGGFSCDTLCEDFDVGLKLKKAGYMLKMSTARIYTNVPQTLNALIKQRTRWSKGTIQVLKKHIDTPFNTRYGAIGLYGVPTQIYWYVHGCFCLPITLYQIFNGYAEYFIAYKNYLSMDVFMYFFSWISIYGMLDYILKTFIGEYTFTLLFSLSFFSFTLGLIYNIAAILRISRLDWKYLFVIFFFFPYSMFMLTVHIAAGLQETVSGRKNSSVNIWEKHI